MSTDLFHQDSPDAETIIGYARVAPERAFDRSPEGLTYAIPACLADLCVGERVIVPLGRGNTPTGAMVVERDVEPEIKVSRIKAIIERDPKSGGSLPIDLVELGKWIASYYCAPLGITLASMLPAAVKHGSGIKRKTMIDFAADYSFLTRYNFDNNLSSKEIEEQSSGDKKSPPPVPRLSKLQKQIIRVLAESPVRPVEIHELRGLAGAKTISPINRLIDAGILTRLLKAHLSALWEDGGTGQPPDQSVTLTGEQAKIVSEITDCLQPCFSAHAVFGVTGSGKTEVYLRLIEKVVSRGQTAIVLVPEISLTPQTVSRFKLRFENILSLLSTNPQDTNHNNSIVAVLHSGLTAPQRHQQWQLIRSGKAKVVIGARSAVFAPFEQGSIGLIVVDEEHDNSYKQDQTPRYHARDVAIKRAQLAKCPVILGSATPSLETYANARIRKIYQWHEINERIPGACFPTIEIVDLAEERRNRPRTDRHVHLLGPRLEHALRRTVYQGGDVILLLNRRGYANYIACPDQNCGWVMTCNHCDVAMVYHKNKQLPRGGYVRCHHCQAEQLLPQKCPLCGNRVSTFGLGTQRIEEELMRKFPDLAQQHAILRMDSDTMNRARDYDRALARFRGSEARILVGTQMIAKGLDFPNVRLVGVINADTAINLPDFRASERTYQLVAQVAGRSGRAEHRGRVIIQTFQPNLPAILYAAKHDYIGFAEHEMKDRLPAALPPIGRMARIIIRHKDHIKCAEIAQKIFDALQQQLIALRLAQTSTMLTTAHQPFQLPADVPPVRLRGPAPCPLSRIADHHRWSIEILSAIGPTPIQQLLTKLRNQGLAKSDNITAIDVDPVHLL